MRRVGDEAALHLHGLRDTGQQPVDGHHERTDFGGKLVFRQWIQFVLAALVDVSGKGGDGAEHLADQIGHDQQQHRYEHQKRQHSNLCAVARDLVAHAGFLGNGNALAGRQRPDQHAVGLVVDFEGAETIGRAGGQCQYLPGAVTAR